MSLLVISHLVASGTPARDLRSLHVQEIIAACREAPEDIVWMLLNRMCDLELEAEAPSHCPECREAL